MKRAGILTILTMAILGASASAMASPIELMVAHYRDGEEHGESWVEGALELEDLALSKHVKVHYRFISGGEFTEWRAARATYRGELSEHTEHWWFETERVEHHSRGVNFELWFEYEVNGRVHRDDNGGENYKLGAGHRSSTYLRSVLGNRTVALVSAKRHRVDRASFSVIVRDFAEDKRVTIVYTGDNWQRIHRADARFQDRMGDDAELWSASLDVHELLGDIEFAVRYTADGATYWDNNFGENYVIRN